MQQWKLFNRPENVVVRHSLADYGRLEYPDRIKGSTMNKPYQDPPPNDPMDGIAMSVKWLRAEYDKMRRIPCRARRVSKAAELMGRLKRDARDLQRLMYEHP